MGQLVPQFDPRDPVAVATKAVADLGVIVVFAAGNSGDTDAEMSLNPFSQAPWVISVAAGTLDHSPRRASRRTACISTTRRPVTIGAGGHTAFTGDRIGVYHPDVTAPGVNISSTCAPPARSSGPCPPPTTRTRPRPARAWPRPTSPGAAAVLLQANPTLTPDQVREALQSTATPVAAAADGSAAAPFWQVGYGYVDLTRP